MTGKQHKTREHQCHCDNKSEPHQSPDSQASTSNQHNTQALSQTVPNQLLVLTHAEQHGLSGTLSCGCPQSKRKQHKQRISRCVVRSDPERKELFAKEK